MPRHNTPKHKPQGHKTPPKRVEREVMSFSTKPSTKRLSFKVGDVVSGITIKHITKEW